MLKSRILLGLIAGMSMAALPAAQDGRPAATPSSNDPALTALDYLEIEQLVYRYGWALDSGENNGYVYADLYAPDGTFTGTNQGPSGRTYRGREDLAALARGGRRGPLIVRHLVTNVVVTPTAEGAVGRTFVAILDLGEPGTSPSAGHGGFYDDVYVKTDRGWRFKQRSYYESRWGEPNVQTPPPIPAVRALKEAAAPALAARGPRLTAQDYVEIQQLVAHYPYALDMNSDNGQSYANLFTPDGTFGCVLPDGSARQPGVPDQCVTQSGQLAPQARPRARGHEALAKMVETEEPHGPNYARHFIFNHVIEPAPGGAIGREYAAVIDLIPGQQSVSHSIYLVGRYDDEYVKTPQGWRFSRRVFTAAARREPPAAAR